jgi:hypothetical protein
LDIFSPSGSSILQAIPFQAVIGNFIWNRGSNEFGACAKLVMGS